MRFNRISYLQATILIFLSSTSNAQLGKLKYEIGIQVGIYVYQGDLAAERFGSLSTLRPGISLHGTRIIDAAFSTRTNLAIAGLRGNDAIYASPDWRRQRNFNFRTPVFELSQLIIYNPLRRNYIDKGFSPYVFAGVGVSALRIRRDWTFYNYEYFDAISDVTQRLILDAAHALPTLTPVIPAGAGFRYNFSPKFAVNLEGNYRFMFTDYLDGFSKSANPDRNDHYYSITGGLIYRFAPKNASDCPVVSY